MLKKRFYLFASSCFRGLIIIISPFKKYCDNDAVWCFIELTYTAEDGDQSVWFQ